MDIVKSCNKCDICVYNNYTPLWGKGNVNANIMFIGEAPTSKDVKLKEVFTNPGGLALRRVLKLYGFNNNNSYFTNTIKCRPPANRAPEFKELANCMPYLLNEIKSINPKIIVLVGNTALRTFYNNFRLHTQNNNGRYEIIQNKIVICIHHPSHILRNQDKIFELEQAMNLILYFYREINPYHVTEL